MYKKTSYIFFCGQRIPFTRSGAIWVDRRIGKDPRYHNFQCRCGNGVVVYVPKARKRVEQWEPSDKIVCPDCFKRSRRELA